MPTSMAPKTSRNFGSVMATRMAGGVGRTGAAEVGMRKAIGPRLAALLGSREILLILINAAIFATLTVLRPDAFPSWTNLKAVLSLMSYDLLVAVAMTMVLIVRGIDLSVGSVLALASVVMALLMRDAVPVVPALAAGLAVALLCGLVNGLLIVKAGILPFLVTLGMMSVARGIATVLTTGQYISFPQAAPWFTQFGRFEFRIPIGAASYGLPAVPAADPSRHRHLGLLLRYWPPLHRPSMSAKARRRRCCPASPSAGSRSRPTSSPPCSSGSPPS